MKFEALINTTENAMSANRVYRILFDISDILIAQRAIIVTAPKIIAVSMSPPERKSGSLAANVAGRYGPPKIPKRVYTAKAIVEYIKAKTTLFTTPTLFIATIVMKVANTNIKIEPEVPRSNTVPATEALIVPESIDEISAITAKRESGIRYLALGISITPVERTAERNTANIATSPVARSDILATYKLTELAGMKNTGNKKTKTERMTPSFLTNKLPELF